MARNDARRRDAYFLTGAARLTDMYRMSQAHSRRHSGAGAARQEGHVDFASRGAGRPARRPEKALAALWSDMLVQRCTVHKHRNLLAHAPDRLHEEISAD
jgi:hypothetical protein